MARRPARTLIAVASVIATALATGAVSLPAQGADAINGAQTSGDVLFPNVGNGGYDVTHYDVEIAWTPGLPVPGSPLAATIDATTTITAATTGPPLKSFSLDFEGEDLTVGSVKVDGVAATVEHEQEPEKTRFKLIVTPQTPVQGPFTTEVNYSGSPATHTDPDGSKEGWIATTDGATFVNQPIGSMTGFPNNNTPMDKATYDFTLDVPSGVTAVSNGELVSNATAAGRTTWIWNQDKPMASELTLISIGQFTMFTGNVTLASGRVLPEWSFVDPTATGQTSATTARGQLKSIIDFFEARYGPYPGNSTGIVVDNMTGTGVSYALETQDRPFYPNSVGVSTHIHEIMHQWFGNNVSPRVWNDLWLGEGPATFGEAQYPNDATEEEFFGLWNSTASSSANWSTPPAAMTDPAKLYGWQVYNRGAMTLEALKAAIGTDDFARVMRQWQLRYAGTSPGTAAFIALAEEIDGRQLDGFFQDWIYDGDKPAWPGKFDLALASSPQSGSVKPGSTVNYTLSAKNTGRVELSGSVVTVNAADVLDDATIKPASLPSGVTMSGNTLTWTVPSTGRGATSTATFPAVVKSGNGSGALVATARAATLGSTCTACRSALGVKLGQLSKTPVPKVVGKAKVGKRLTVRAGSWDQGVTLRYQWFVGKRAIKGATGKTFKVRKKHVGKRLQVRVTGTKPGFMPETVRSKRTSRVR